MELRRRMQELSRADKYPFHMPGHKNSFPELFGQFDPTELPGLDNLHCPEDLLKRVQDKVAGIYRTGQTYFLVNGTSVGLMAAITSAVGPGDFVLVQRSCHKAVFAGLIHSGAMPVWLEQDFSSRFKHWLPPAPDQVAQILHAYPIRAAVFTNPDYFGLVPDIKELVKICHGSGAIVIADEAHGAHLSFGRSLGLPLSAVDAGCDIIVQSPHKTLPALTQAAWLHLNNSGLSEAIQQNLNLFHTTSPSYLLLSSLEYAGNYANLHANYGLRQLAVLVKLLELRGRQLNLTIWPKGGRRDWTKFTLSNRIGLEQLLLKAGIYPELVQAEKVLLMLTLADALSPEGVYSLYRLLPKIASLPLAPKGNNLIPPAPCQECPPREAWLHPGQRVPIHQALGRIARQVVAPYPPGTMVVAPGQRLGREHIQYLTYLHAGKVISPWIEVI